MFKWIMAGLVAVALLSAFGVPEAVAAESSEAFGGAILLKGTHDFRIEATFGVKDGRGSMQLFAIGRGELAIYEASGEVTPERIDFDLGSLGKFDVEKLPTGRTETIHACGETSAEPGYEFVGTIEFHGEEGFTEAVATRAKLPWAALLQPTCEWSGFGEDFGPTLPGVRIKARKKQGPELQLDQNRPGAAVLYSAQVTERHAPIAIERFVSGHLPAKALSFAPSLGSATFVGAGPFEGKATYAGVEPPRGTHPGHGAWRGDLTVDFPGADGVRLAGPGFSAGIIHAHYSASHGKSSS